MKNNLFTLFTRLLMTLVLLMAVFAAAGCGNNKADEQKAVDNQNEIASFAIADPTGEVAGRKMTAAKVMAEVERDIIFYDQSGGGVTFSGGEPLAQAGFLLELLAGCREREIHATVDTTGYSPLDKLLQVSEFTNLFLYDLKVMDQELHRRYTGVSNRLVLDNLRELASRRKNIVIRVPVIPGINDDHGNITDTGRFVSSLPGVNKVQILPYHRAGREKYRRLGLEYNLSGLRPPGDALMDNIAVNLRKFGLEVQVGHQTNI